MRPIRFLFSNYEYPPIGGGGGTECKALARELLLAGHSVEVVTAAFGELARDFRRGGYRVRRLPCVRLRAGRCTPPEMLSWAAVAVPWLLARRDPRPDVILSFHSIPSGLTGFPVSEAWGIPHLVRFEGGDVPGWLPGDLARYHAMTLWLNRLIVNRSAFALANSDGLRDLAAKAFPDKRIDVLSNGADTIRFRPPDDGRRGRSGPVRLLFVGRLTSQKGLDTLLDALGRVGTEADWTLDVAGFGPLEDALRREAQERGIAGRIRFRGWMERDAVRDLYRESDAFILPSRYEGMPNVVLEAMASGLPVIGSNIMGTVELVVPGETGILVPVDDAGALADAISTLVGDGGLRLSMGDAGRRRIECEWSWARRAEELVEYARRALEDQTRASRASRTR